MTKVTVSAGSLHVCFTLRQKLAGLVRDLQVPLSSIRSAEVVPDGLNAVRGVRAPGLDLPGLRRIGTWRRRGTRTLVAVRRGCPALRLRLHGQRYDELLLGVNDATTLLAEVAPAGGATNRPH
ncbi:hypothetical protein FHR75_004464 [Kineococcus radiotolerans]|uniref:Uncharacterized protein n=1 Tax=Kineococcus radiotolerans TaxID=131568 RepID=A0A7W4TR84_KINRA|nr:hypothetical protein [Kineococcus radiotolerans]MBB2903621.1 hypothetical protein [Kineococcus radiotolerans]